MTMCHNRGPSPVRELEEAAAHAAHALDDWRLTRPHEAADVQDFLQKIAPAMHSNPSLILVVYRAHQGWSGEKVPTVPELLQKVRVVIDRLASAMACHTTTDAEELATLRDFCLEISRQAHVSAS
jgi:hypothetical protein